MTNFLQPDWLGDMQFSGNIMQKRGTSLQKIAHSLQKKATILSRILDLFAAQKPDFQ